MNRVFFYTVLASCVCASSAHAKDEVHGRDQVVVTPETDEETGPNALTTLDLEDDRYQGQDLAAILATQPGLRITRIGGQYSSAYASIRGSTPEQVLVYLDGIPLNAATGGAVDLASLPLGPLKSVTIFRSASATGVSAMGGVISLETKSTGKPSTQGYSEAGSYRTFALRGSQTLGVGSLRTLVGLDTVSSQGDFSYLNDQGTLFTGSEGDDEEVARLNNHTRQGSIILKMGWQPSRRLNVKLLELVTGQVSGVPGLGVVQTSETAYEKLRTLTGLTARWRSLAGDLTLTSATHLAYGLSELRDPLGEVALTRGSFQDETVSAGSRAVLDGVLEGVLGSWLDLITRWSAEARYERFRPDESMVTVNPSQRLMANTGLRVQGIVDSIGLETIGSIQLEHSRSDVEAPEYLWASTAGDIPEMEPYTALTWYLGATLKALDHLTLRANIAHAVRMPNLFELFGNSGTVRGNPALLPEEGLNVDAGMALDYYLSPGRTSLTLELMGFARWTEGLIQFSQNAQNVALARNVESATLQGIEVASSVHTLEALRLDATLTALHTRNETEVAAREGRNLPRRPALQAFARAEMYWHPGVLADELAVEAQVEHTRGNFLDSANLVAVPERWLVGTGVRGQLNESWDVGAYLRNITDSRVQDLSGFPLPGRSVMMTVRYRDGHASEEG